MHRLAENIMDHELPQEIRVVSSRKLLQEQRDTEVLEAQV